MDNGDIVHFGDIEKNGFQISYHNSATPDMIIETKNALGTEESETLRFDNDCNIKQVARNSDFGLMEVTSDFCNKFESNKTKLSAKDMENPSLAMKAGSAFDKCYSSFKGYSVCEAYSGKFSRSSGSSLSTPPKQSSHADGSK